MTKIYGVDYRPENSSKQPFIKVDYNVIVQTHDYRLSDAAFRIYCSLKTWGGVKDIRPSVDLIGWRVGKGRSQTYRALAELVQANLIVKHVRPGKTTLYKLSRPLIANNPYGNPESSSLKNRKEPIREVAHKVDKDNKYYKDKYDKNESDSVFFNDPFT